MPKPGPRPGQIKLSDSHRDKIRNSQILTRLIGHVEGRVEMSSSQVTAGLGLLKKVMPDMTEASIQHDVSDPLQDIVNYVATNGGRIG